jgi:hypothetical protein
MLLLSFIKVLDVTVPSDQIDPAAPMSKMIYAVMYITRFIAELFAMILAVQQGKYLQIASSPLALEWQPSNYIDSMLLCFFQFGTGVITMSFAIVAHTIYIRSVDYLNYSYYSSNEARPPIMKADFIGLIVFAIISAALLVWSVVAAGWIHYHKGTLETGSKDVILFLFWAQLVAIAWEGFGIIMDILYIPLLAARIDKASASVGI